MAEIEGMNEFIARLASLGDVEAARATRAAVKAGAEVIRVAAAQKAPKKSGHLAESIMIKVVEAAPTTAAALIGPDSDHYYGLMVEYGHKVQFGTDAPVTGHVPPHPFMRPALDENRATAQEVMAATLKERLDP